MIIEHLTNKYMRKTISIIIILFFSLPVIAQSPKTEIYDFIKGFLYDSTGYENIGNWAVGNPKKYPVAWKADKIEMSNDTSINFFRMGTANITVRGKEITSADKSAKWNIMLKGPRMGYGSFSLLSPPSVDLHEKVTIDSLFKGKSFKAKLLKACDNKAITGFYYYELKLPKKDVAYIKITWLTVNGSTAYRIDCFDSYSKYAVKLECK